MNPSSPDIDGKTKIPDVSNWTIDQCRRWFDKNVAEPDTSTLRGRPVAAWRDAVLAEARANAEFDATEKAAAPVPPHSSVDKRQRDEGGERLVPERTAGGAEFCPECGGKPWSIVGGVCGVCRNTSPTTPTADSGIFLKPSHNKPPQSGECYCCAKIVNPKTAIRVLIDRDTEEVLADTAENAERGAIWPIGPECVKKYPGIKAHHAPVHGPSPSAPGPALPRQDEELSKSVKLIDADVLTEATKIAGFDKAEADWWSFYTAKAGSKTPGYSATRKLAATVVALSADVARLQGVVDKLPKLADGVSAVDGMDVYRSGIDAMFGAVVETSVKWIVNSGDDEGMHVSDDVQKFYSTETAALAAHQQSEGGPSTAPEQTESEAGNGA